MAAARETGRAGAPGRARRWLLPALLPVFILLALVFQVEPESAWRALTLLSPARLGLVLLVYAAVCGSAILKNRFLLRLAGHRVPLGKLIPIFFLSAVAHYTVPGKAGYPVMAWLLQRRARVPYSASSAVLTLDFLASLCFTLWLALAGSALYFGQQLLPALLVALLAPLAMLAGGLFIRRWLAGRAGTGRITVFLRDTAAAAAGVATWRAWPLAVFYALNALLCGLALWLLVAPFGNVTVGRLVTADALSFLLGALSLIPMGIGVQDASLLALLTGFGLDRAAALNTVVAQRMLYLVPVYLLGALTQLLWRDDEPAGDAGPDRRRLLLLTTSFASPTAGRASAHFLYPPALALTQAGYAVHVLMPLRAGQPEEERCDGMTIRRFRYPLMRFAPAYRHRALYAIRSPLALLATLALFAAYLSAIRRCCREQRLGVVWANWLQTGYIAALALGRAVPLCVTLQGSDIRNCPAPLVRWMARRVPLVLNPYGGDREIAGWIRRFGFRELRVPNVYRERVPAGTADRAHVVVVGRLEDGAEHYRVKGIGAPLFRVIRRVAEQCPEARFTIVGAGAQAEKFRALCRDLGGRVRFTGWLDNYDEWLDSAGLVLGASGHGGVTLETVPYGVPVLISRHDPAADFWVDGVNCRRFDPDDEPGFAAVIMRAIAQPEESRRLAERARLDFREYAQPVCAAAPAWADALTAVPRR